MCYDQLKHQTDDVALTALLTVAFVDGMEVTPWHLHSLLLQRSNKIDLNYYGCDADDVMYFEGYEIDSCHDWSELNVAVEHRCSVAVDVGDENAVVE